MPGIWLTFAVVLSVVALALMVAGLAIASKKGSVPSGLVASVYLTGAAYSTVVCVMLVQLVAKAVHLSGG